MILRFIGRIFIAAGVLILLFLAYEVFGTNFVTERNQRALAASFDHELRAPSESPGPPPKPEVGDGIARMIIRKIDLDRVVVEGVGVEALKKGPGHMSATALPGEIGNVVISGHRTTYGAPFWRLDELVLGDEISMVTRAGSHIYRVTEVKVVKPTDLSVTEPSPSEFRLTLTTCHPRLSARQRLIVVARMVEPEEQASR